MTNMERNPAWAINTRRHNQVNGFKEMSANLFREVEVAYLRKLQNDPKIRSDPSRTFTADRLDKINALLSNVYIDATGDKTEFITYSGDKVSPDDLSSGESEAIALAVEIMYFFDTLDVGRFNLLLLDEPDVHLHADLQSRLAKYIVDLTRGLDDSFKPRTAIIVATHSTALVCALASYEYTSIGTKQFGIDSVSFSRVPEELRKTAPFFGHPLSMTLGNDPILILEGSDDERVWQQAARSSKGRVKVFPVLAETVDKQGSLECFCSRVLTAIYDDPVAYSLRDGDSKPEPLNAIGPVIRFRLSCYEVENMLVADESLRAMGITWAEFCDKARKWVESNPKHDSVGLVRKLVNSADRLRFVKIKDIRNIICSISNSNKPWQVVIGQALGTVTAPPVSVGSSSILSFLGVDAASKLLALDLSSCELPSHMGGSPPDAR